LRTSQIEENHFAARAASRRAPDSDRKFREECSLERVASAECIGFCVLLFSKT